jgi:hypothetical protein
MSQRPGTFFKSFFPLSLLLSHSNSTQPPFAAHRGSIVCLPLPFCCPCLSPQPCQPLLLLLLPLHYPIPSYPYPYPYRRIRVFGSNAIPTLSTPIISFIPPDSNSDCLMHAYQNQKRVGIYPGTSSPPPPSGHSPSPKVATDWPFYKPSAPCGEVMRTARFDMLLWLLRNRDPPSGPQSTIIMT